jgi:hypothetical protein
MYTTWNQASLAALEDIFGHQSTTGTVKDLRTQLDTLIEQSWTPQAGDDRHVHAAWKNIGATAHNLTKTLDFSKKIAFGSAYMHTIVTKKQHDYGPENIARFGRTGLLVRMHDKIARLENLLESQRTPENESINDNIFDVIGYSCIAMMWEDGTFLLPLEHVTVVESKTVIVTEQLSAGDIIAKAALSIHL